MFIDESKSSECNFSRRCPGLRRRFLIRCFFRGAMGAMSRTIAANSAVSGCPVLMSASRRAMFFAEIFFYERNAVISSSCRAFSRSSVGFLLQALHSPPLLLFPPKCSLGLFRPQRGQYLSVDHATPRDARRAELFVITAPPPHENPAPHHRDRPPLPRCISRWRG